MSPWHAAVDGLMRKVGRDVVMRHFGRLSAEQIEEKDGSADLVTIADKASEARLIEGLTKIIPGSHVVGEEGVAANPALIERIGEGRCWVVDPIDGTHNFASGKSPFAIMIALVEEGETQAGWILDPATKAMLHAERGRGAYLDNKPVRARESGAALPIAALATRYLPDEVRAEVLRRSEGRLAHADIPNCAGDQYARLVAGVNDLALFWRSKPWDHLPGALILAEAGGRLARLDGSPYRAIEAPNGQIGLLAAASPRLWDEAARTLFG